MGDPSVSQDWSQSVAQPVSIAVTVRVPAWSKDLKGLLN
jgi:hypothetical protein